MRRMAFGLALFGFHLAFVMSVRAADDDAKAVIEKAIKAHFPKGLDTTHKGVRTKSKGTLHVMGLDLEFTQEVAIQLPNKLKETMELDVMGNKVNVVSVYDGKQAWIHAGDKDVEVTKEILQEFKDAVYTMGLMQGMFLKDKALKLSLVGETKVRDKPAIGVKISREGKKDLTLYVDKSSGLIVKVEMRKRDIQSMQEIQEERYITEYQDASGRKVAKKVEVVRDGKPYLEAEVTSVEILDSIDASEFTKPN